MRLLDQLLDQLPVMVAFTLAVAFLLLVVHLGVSPLSRGEAGYVLLLALVSLAVVLGVDNLRKKAFRSEVHRRLETGDVMAAAPLPHPASREQRALTRLLEGSQAAATARLTDLRRVADEHRKFIDQWVHQMKTPVNVIQLAADRRDDAAWDDVLEEAARLADGLELVLAASRLERFELDYAPTESDLTALVKGMLNELRGAFIRSGVFPRVKNEGAVSAVTDPKWLQVVLRQLLTNAIKYSPSGSQVTVSVSQDGAVSVIAVADTGAGIPPEDLPRVFERYFTGTNGRRFGASTGMGLHLAAEVCRRLGHELAIESSVPGGTTAVVRIGRAGVHLFDETAGQPATGREVTGT